MFVRRRSMSFSYDFTKNDGDFSFRWNLIFFLLLDSKKWVSFSRRFPIFSSPFRDIICMLPLKCRSFPFTHAYTITTTTTTTATTTTNVSYQSVRSWFFSFFPIFVMPVFRNIVQRSSFALFLLWWRRITFLIRCFFFTQIWPIQSV